MHCLGVSVFILYLLSFFPMFFSVYMKLIFQINENNKKYASCLLVLFCF